MEIKDFLNKVITVKIDRKLGSKHPKHGFIYPLNYGYVQNTVSGDGEELDCYVLGVFEPVEEYTGKCIAIIHRLNDDDDKLVIVPEEKNYTDDEINALVEFQERFFEHEIIREKVKGNLYVITGPAGVGKSTVSKELAKSKSKSVVIEGDEIYSQVVGGYVSAWKEGNHLEVFWQICLDNIETYLENGYDVVFNYIVTPANYNKIQDRFKKYNTKFVVLMADEEVILQRDNQRSEDCRMKERCIVLLNNFKKYNFEKRYILDNTKLTVVDTVKMIINESKFII